MANTAPLQDAIHWVREDLGRQFGLSMTKARVSLRTGGERTFNAVADDVSIVATVMNSSGSTSGGKKPIGKIRGAVAELYYLSLVEDARRLLVVTNPDFYAILRQEFRGALIEEIELIHLPLPRNLAASVGRVHGAASDEMA